MLNKSVLIRLVLIAVLVTTVIGLTPRPAKAGWACDIFGLCGVVTNSSSGNLTIRGNRVEGGPFYTYTLGVGQTSNGAPIYLPDTDYVSAPSRFLKIDGQILNPGQFYKISDGRYINCVDHLIYGQVGVLCQ
jgi:hypothetical protein